MRKIDIERKRVRNRDRLIEKQEGRKDRGRRDRESRKDVMTDRAIETDEKEIQILKETKRNIEERKKR